MPTITPFLWFDTQAQEAMTFYTSIFRDSRVISSHPMVVQFELLGQRFVGLNAGPHHKFTEAVSFFVEVDTQQEVDHYWDALLAGGGRPDRCGWLKDKFGLSWQVIPKALPQLVTDPDPAKAKRAMEAMMTMIKIDLAEVERAHANGTPEGTHSISSRRHYATLQRKSSPLRQIRTQLLRRG